ncbi:choline dehydrogenase [Rhypophila decipiens]
MLSNLLVAALCAAHSVAGAGSSEARQVGTSYDYIVIGGGTAGAAVATRLSRGLRRASILLIEAGPAALDEDRINIPGNRGSTLGTVYDWAFSTVPQAATKNRVWGAPRGKVLGGSSALNLMSWDRASAPEYDWERLGNKGWNWRTMIAAMKRAETFTPSPDYGVTGVGDSGPIKSVINRFIPEQQKSWIPTMNNLGLPHNLESLGGNPLGVMYQPNNIDPVPWNRSYSANSYLPIASSNLETLTNTRVIKINLQKKGRSVVATGVTIQGGTIIAAREEVILSAGSIQSPGLLELSGIGQSSVLSAAGINQVIDLRGVGENLQDHIRIQTSFQLKDNYTSFDKIRINATFRQEQLALRAAGKVSMMDYAGSAYAFLLWKQVSASVSSSLTSLARSLFSKSSSKIEKQKLTWLNDPRVPQVEVIFSDGYTGGTKGYPAPTSPRFGKSFFTLITAIMHPFSRGSVHISSADIEVKPTLDPKYLSNEYDIQAAIAAIRYARKIANTAPLRDLWVAEYEPGLDAVPESGDNTAQYRDFVLNTTLSIFHPIGTCAMLPKKDGGVVDSRLVVYGTTNLRVVDASVMPLLISGHIQTAVYGIAERAADMIIEDAR